LKEILAIDLFSAVFCNHHINAIFILLIKIVTITVQILLFLIGKVSEVE